MIITLVLKGGPPSGWYAPPKGTHTGEKHRAVGSGKAGAPTRKVKVRLVSKSAEKKRGSNKLVYYQSDGGAQFPSSIVGMEYGVIMYNPKTGTLYATSMASVIEGVGAGFTGHADLATAIGIPTDEFDSYVRPWIEEGEVGADFRQAGVSPDISGRTDIKAAERNVVRTAKAMVRAGFSSNQNVFWTVEYTPKGAVTLDLKLGQVR